MDNIYNILNNYLKRQNPGGNNETICHFMLNHLREIPEMSVNEMAQKCYTSNPSITRFTRELGFDGLADFKFYVKEYLEELDRKKFSFQIPLDPLNEEKQLSAGIDRWLDEESAYIKESLKPLDQKKLKGFCKELHDHENVYFVSAGVSGTLADLFRIFLARCGKIVQCVAGNLNMLDVKDEGEGMIVILSIYGHYLQGYGRGFLNAYKKNPRKIWLITSEEKLDLPYVSGKITLGDSERPIGANMNLMIYFLEMICQIYQQMYPYQK
ncbi:MAG: MurR/RpiR family transcriptional regulator [Erysipelotrichaceae bacterium]|nr:MurR/RpiR family transcriptional regulator [Erysipelotrichaceae bacterium]